MSMQSSPLRLQLYPPRRKLADAYSGDEAGLDRKRWKCSPTEGTVERNPKNTAGLSQPPVRRNQPRPARPEANELVCSTSQAVLLDARLGRILGLLFRRLMLLISRSIACTAARVVAFKSGR